MKRWIYILLLAVIFTPTAYADTGFLNVSNYLTKSDYAMVGTAGVDSGAVFTKAYIKDTEYDVFYMFAWKNDGCTFPYTTNSTTFTITSGAQTVSGGVVSGFVSYNTAISKKVTWNILDAAFITGNEITFSYTTNIFDGVSCAGADHAKQLDALTANAPMGLGTVVANQVHESFGANVDRYDFTGSSNTWSRYTVTYPSQNYFQINFEKAQEETVKIYIFNQTDHSYAFDAAFSLSNVSFFGNNTGKIFANITMSAGGTNEITINSTDPNAVVVPTPPYGGGGSQNGQMNFDTVQPYFKGYFGINVSMNATTFDSNKRYFIDVFDPSGKEKAGFPIEISSATYYTGRNWVFSDLGLWNATLTDCNQFNFLCGATGFSGLPPSYQQLIDCVNNPLCGTRSNLVDVAVQVINASEYTYTITSEATKYATNDTIHFNITSTNPVGAYFTILDSLGNVVNPLANNVLVGEGVTLYNVTIPNTIQNGNYTAILALNTGYYAQVKAYQFSIGIVPGRDSISWGDNNIFGYTNTLSWSNGNWTNYISVSKTLNGTLTETDNFTVSNLSVSSKPYLMDTVGFWSAKLYNTTTGTSKYANMSVFASSVGLCNTKLDDFICFNNQSYYPGDTYKINYQMNTISNCLLSGPCIDPYSKIIVSVRNPNGVTVFNKTLVDCSGSITSCYVSKPLIGTLTSMFKVSDVPGTYQVKLIYTHKDRQIGVNEYIDDIIASNTAVLVSKPVPTPTPPTGSGAMSTLGGNLLLFLSTPAFWGTMIWFALVIVSASSGSKNAMSNTGVVALAAALILSVVGLFDPYRWFVLAGLIIITGIYFMVGRNITTGD